MGVICPNPDCRVSIKGHGFSDRGCRNCFGIFCAACVRVQHNVIMNDKKRHRVCMTCYVMIVKHTEAYNNKLVAAQNLQWAAFVGEHNSGRKVPDVPRDLGNNVRQSGGRALPRGWSSCVQKCGKTLYYKGHPDHPPTITIDAEGKHHADFDPQYPGTAASWTRPKCPE